LKAEATSLYDAFLRAATSFPEGLFREGSEDSNALNKVGQVAGYRALNRFGE